MLKKSIHTQLCYIVLLLFSSSFVHAAQNGKKKSLKLEVSDENFYEEYYEKGENGVYYEPKNKKNKFALSIERYNEVYYKVYRYAKQDFLKKIRAFDHQVYRLQTILKWSEGQNNNNKDHNVNGKYHYSSLPALKNIWETYDYHYKKGDPIQAKKNAAQVLVVYIEHLKEKKDDKVSFIKKNTLKFLQETLLKGNYNGNERFSYNTKLEDIEKLYEEGSNYSCNDDYVKKQITSNFTQIKKELNSIPGLFPEIFESYGYNEICEHITVEDDSDLYNKPQDDSYYKITDEIKNKSFGSLDAQLEKIVDDIKEYITVGGKGEKELDEQERKKKEKEKEEQELELQKEKHKKSLERKKLNIQLKNEENEVNERENYAIKQRVNNMNHQNELLKDNLLAEQMRTDLNIAIQETQITQLNKENKLIEAENINTEKKGNRIDKRINLQKKQQKLKELEISQKIELEKRKKELQIDSQIDLQKKEKELINSKHRAREAEAEGQINSEKKKKQLLLLKEENVKKDINIQKLRNNQIKEDLTIQNIKINQEKEERESKQKLLDVDTKNKEASTKLEETKQKTIRAQTEAVGKRLESFKKFFSNWKMLGTVGSAFIMVFLFYKMIPYLLKAFFEPIPDIIKSTSLPTTWSAWFKRLLFRKKKGRSMMHLMRYNEKEWNFVVKEIERTKKIQIHNAKAKKKKDKLGHNNILLFGPPGGGKTFLAKEISTSCGMNYVIVNTPRIASMSIRDAIAMIGKLFRYAKQFKTQVVIVFDEVDAIFTERDKNYKGNRSDKELDQKVVNVFLNEIERMNDPNIKLIGITNLSKNLDSAFKRRFSLHKIGRPNLQTRKELLKVYIKEYIVQAGIQVDPAIMKEENLTAIAKRLEGKTGSHIQGMVSLLQSTAKTRKEQYNKITLEDIKDYLDEAERSKEE